MKSLFFALLIFLVLLAHAQGPECASTLAITPQEPVDERPPMSEERRTLALGMMSYAKNIDPKDESRLQKIYRMFELSYHQIRVGTKDISPQVAELYVNGQVTSALSILLGVRREDLNFLEDQKWRAAMSLNWFAVRTLIRNRTYMLSRRFKVLNATEVLQQIIVLETFIFEMIEANPQARLLRRGSSQTTLLSVLTVINPLKVQIAGTNEILKINVTSQSIAHSQVHFAQGLDPIHNLDHAMILSRRNVTSVLLNRISLNQFLNNLTDKIFTDEQPMPASSVESNDPSVSAIEFITRIFDDRSPVKFRLLFCRELFCKGAGGRIFQKNEMITLIPLYGPGVVMIPPRRVLNSYRHQGLTSLPREAVRRIERQDLVNEPVI